MSFVLLVCSEIVGEKVNLEFPFPQKPAVAELYETVERVFRFETSNSSRAHLGQQLYTISKVQVYSDEARQWVDLHSSGQLHAYDQLYVFPRGARMETDSARRELPRPRSSLYFAAKVGNLNGLPTPSKLESVQPLAAPAAPVERSVSNGQDRHSAADIPLPPPPSSRPVAYNSQPNTPRGGVQSARGDYPHHSASSSYGAVANNNSLGGVLDVVSPHEQARICFEYADRRRNGVINAHDFFDLFRSFNIRFAKELCDEMFSSTIGNRDTMSFLATLFSRLQAKERGEQLREAQKQNEEVIGDLTRQKEKLESALKRLNDDLRREHQRADGIAEHLRLIDIQLLEEDDEEIALLEKEVRVQQHRAMLKREEEDLQYLTKKRRELHASRTPSVASSSIYNSYDRR